MKLYVQDAGFSYAGAPALEHVTFCAMPGECTAVLGGNGAGKSTLLRNQGDDKAPLFYPDASVPFQRRQCQSP